MHSVRLVCIVCTVCTVCTVCPVCSMCIVVTVCTMCTKGAQCAQCALNVHCVHFRPMSAYMPQAVQCAQRVLRQNLTTACVYQYPGYAGARWAGLNKLIIRYPLLPNLEKIGVWTCHCHGHRIGQDHLGRLKCDPIAIPRTMYKTHPCALKLGTCFQVCGAPKMTPIFDILSFCRE